MKLTILEVHPSRTHPRDELVRDVLDHEHRARIKTQLVLLADLALLVLRQVSKDAGGGVER